MSDKVRFVDVEDVMAVYLDPMSEFYAGDLFASVWTNILTEQQKIAVSINFVSEK